MTNAHHTTVQAVNDSERSSGLEAAVKSRTKDLELLAQSQEQTKRAMLNVMEDLESARDLIELERAKDEAILASIGEGLIAVDNDRKIIMMNDAAEGLLDLKIADMIGKDVTDVPLYDEKNDVIAKDQRPTYQAIQTGKPVSTTCFFIRQDGIKFRMAINVTPIKLENKIIGAIDIFRDITRESEIDRSKSEFVSLASHQLRTPLGISKWYLEALKDEGFLDQLSETAKDYFNEVYKSNERLLALVRDLLSVSRIEQEKVRNVPQDVEMPKLMASVIKNMKILANKNKITLHFEQKKTGIKSIYIDPLRVQEAIENLITNAITYSTTPNKVEVILDADADHILIEVIDNGIGISAADQKKIFTKFFRSEIAVTKNTEGSGLGLYVVKSYLETWGGKVKVMSAEKKGSTFSISLPYSLNTTKP